MPLCRTTSAQPYVADVHEPNEVAHQHGSSLQEPQRTDVMDYRENHSPSGLPIAR